MLLCVLLVLPFCIAIPTNLEHAFEMEPYNTMPAPTKILATPVGLKDCQQKQARTPGI